MIFVHLDTEMLVRRWFTRIQSALGCFTSNYAGTHLVACIFGKNLYIHQIKTNKKLKFAFTTREKLGCLFLNSIFGEAIAKNKTKQNFNTVLHTD